MEDSDTSAAEKVGQRAEIAGSNGGSQVLLAYAVAGVALAAVIVSGIMFISHYPAGEPVQAVDAQREELRRAPTRLVSPRAITAEETRGSRPEQAAEAQSTPRVPGGSKDVRVATIDALSNEPAGSEPKSPERITAEPGPIVPLPREERPLGAVAGEDSAQSASRLVSTTLRSETLGTQPPPEEDIALARSEEQPEIREQAPSEEVEDGHQEQPLPAPDQRSSGKVESQAAQVDHELPPPAPLAQPPREGPGYPYPGTRRPYIPPMPPFPPPPFYMPRGPGHAGGYYPMNAAASDD